MSDREQHYPYVDNAVPVGVGHVCQAVCTCGWCGTLGASPEEARLEKFAHARDTYAPTWDDICWELGIGRWAQ